MASPIAIMCVEMDDPAATVYGHRQRHNHAPLLCAVHIVGGRFCCYVVSQLVADPDFGWFQ
jgi:hypothetical protein